MPSADAVADGYEAVQRPKVRNDLQGPSLRKSSNTTRTAPELRWTEAEPFQQVDAEKAYQSVQGPSLRKSSKTTRTAPELPWTEAVPFQQVDAEKAYQSEQGPSLRKSSNTTQTAPDVQMVETLPSQRIHAYEYQSVQGPSLRGRSNALPLEETVPTQRVDANEYQSVQGRSLRESSITPQATDERNWNQGLGLDTQSPRSTTDWSGRQTTRTTETDIAPATENPFVVGETRQSVTGNKTIDDASKPALVDRTTNRSTGKLVNKSFNDTPTADSLVLTQPKAVKTTSGRRTASRKKAAGGWGWLGFLPLLLLPLVGWFCWKMFGIGRTQDEEEVVPFAPLQTPSSRIASGSRPAQKIKIQIAENTAPVEKDTSFPVLSSESVAGSTTKERTTLNGISGSSFENEETEELSQFSARTESVEFELGDTASAEFDREVQLAPESTGNPTTRSGHTTDPKSERQLGFEFEGEKTTSTEFNRETRLTPESTEGRTTRTEHISGLDKAAAEGQLNFEFQGEETASAEFNRKDRTTELESGYDQDFDFELESDLNLESTASETNSFATTNDAQGSDDLTKIRGIGPATAGLLHKSGISNFESLRNASPQRLQQILSEGGKRFRLIDSSLWSQQAEFGFNGDWSGLRKWQDENCESTEATSEASQTVAKTQEPEARSQTRDDLTKIRGIGPATAELLHKSGISNFESLQKTSPQRLQQILSEGGERFRLIDSSLWSQQAEFGFTGDWSGLQKWQDENCESTAGTSQASRTATKTQKTQTRDDLKKIRGIGPASQKVLFANGVETFEELAQRSPEELCQMFENQNNRFSMLDVSTWPTQARAFTDLQQTSEEEALLNEVNEIRDIAKSANRSAEKPATERQAKAKKQHS